MGISRRLGRGARSVADAARSHREEPPTDEPRTDEGGEGGEGAGEAAYARILDGLHLWVALPARDGRPALQDPATGELVDVDPRPVEGGGVEDGGADPAHHAARWRLEDVVAAEADAELRLVAVGDPDGTDRTDGRDGRPRPLRPPPTPPGSLRVPPTPDGRWRFQLETDHDGFLRVRRTAAPRVAVLVSIEDLDGAVRLVVRRPDPVPAPPPDPALLFLDRNRRVVARVAARTGTAGPAEVSVVVALVDLPGAPGGYRVAIETAADPVPVVRLHRDLRIADPDVVPLPSVLEPDSGRLAGRFQFGPQGALRLVRRDPAVVGADEETS